MIERIGGAEGIRTLDPLNAIRVTPMLLITRSPNEAGKRLDAIPGTILGTVGQFRTFQANYLFL